MIQSPDNWDDKLADRSPREVLPRRVSTSPAKPSLEDCRSVPPSKYLFTRKIEDTGLAITFACTCVDLSTSDKDISLTRSAPVQFSALDATGNLIVTYELDSGKLSARQRHAIGSRLAKVGVQRCQGERTPTTQELLELVFNRTRSIEGAWSTKLPATKPFNGLADAIPVASPPSPALMTHRIPDVEGYLKDPLKLGRVYQSAVVEALHARTVVIELDPRRNLAHFIIEGNSDPTPETAMKRVVMTVPGPAQGSLCTETAMRHLRVMSWNALEKLRDEGPQQFFRHLRQLKSETHSVHIKHLPTQASFQVFATSAETLIVLASRPFRPEGIEGPLPARCVLRFPGNAQNPRHPLHSLLVDLATALKNPDSEQQVSHIVGQLVKVLRGCDRSSIASLAPALQGIFGPDTLTFLQSIPGISIKPVAPGEQGNIPTHDGLAGIDPSDRVQLSRAVAEVAKGISRVHVKPTDNRRWRSFPEAFNSLTLDVHADQSLLIRASNSCGASLQCFLSRASRFPEHFRRDLAELICKTFAQQVEQGTLVESRGLLLEVLTTLVKTDPERNFLCYRSNPHVS